MLTLACASPLPGASRAPAAAATHGTTTTSGSEQAAREQALAAAGFELTTQGEPAPARSEPPTLPPAFVSPLEVTLELSRTSLLHGRRIIRREDVARGADRVHVRVTESGDEWLFVQNPTDARRVSARLVNHRERAIVDYDESELRINGIARGWSDVVGLGADLTAMRALERTGRTLRRFGFEFAEWHSSTGAPALELWWSDAATLPLRVAGLGAESVEITAVRRGVERERLLEPRERFVGYAVMDVADYREKHHDAAETPARAGPARPLEQRTIRPEVPVR